MRRVHLTEEWLQGAVSYEWTGAGIKPWRIPYPDFELFPPEGIEGKAAICAGIRLRFQSNTTEVVLAFEPIQEAASIDCLVDGMLLTSIRLEAGTSKAAWRDLPLRSKCIDLWLPQNMGMTILSLEVDQDAEAEAETDPRPRWIAYGSSITQCVGAESPSYTWPSIASRTLGLNLTCLGFSGNCHLEPMVARMIRDLPADLITLCLGINVYGAETMNLRTFRPAVIGMLEILREKHTDTPLVIVSPIFAAERESRENKLGMTVSSIRREVAVAVEMLQQRGDLNLYYRDGRDWFGPADEALLYDGLHPNADGYKLLGDRFGEQVLSSIQVPGRLDRAQPEE
ncbi:GDSL family lipase [Paenibacillus rhizosphaerae]|uniref:GDSL family lipase n=1 Tax=Paenibacillus rhizosphaerae TaxID=297318 RepID=A0A1R1E622_9BACL|nr:SGNH/GDSL hydrolase family protein [Paenibacillus rhizosphaerae]OMF47274.1 GDSL family lipase [Paenibacillus rhizosphaerae]